MASALPYNPIVFTQAGEEYELPARILAIVWEGATAAGDTAVLRHRETDRVLWPGRADGTNTYQGINIGPHGVHTPKGFYASQLSAGRLVVYLREH